MDSAIEITDLRKSFDGGKEFVLNGLNLSIPKGKLTVVIGYSGTGKSVMLKHMLGLLKPTSGTINVLGHDLWTMEPEELQKIRTRLGVLFQHAALFDDMTVLENVCFPLIEHAPHYTMEQIVDIAVQKLQMSGMDEKHYNKLPGALSGGMRKRVGLARALSLDPEIIFYDEPTTGLDPILTEMVDDLILQTQKNHPGCTSLVVTHDLMAGFRIGDYVVMLDKGKVLLTGTPEDFLKSDVELVKRFIDKGMNKHHGRDS